jgi:hypothetical protein
MILSISHSLIGVRLGASAQPPLRLLTSYNKSLANFFAVHQGLLQHCLGADAAAVCHLSRFLHSA